jgi:membrane protein YqaA with SNARE-associated domain
MKEFFLPLFHFLTHMGAFGLLLMGIFDSSFLFLPLGNDLLMLVLTASHPARLAFYALMATIGSAIGSAIIDRIARKGGEEGLQRLLPRRRAEYIKKRVRRNAGYALALAALMPPPFPFTAFVAAAAAFQYPRRQLLIILTAARYLRFAAIGLLGVSFGRAVLRLANSSVVQYTMFGIVAISIIGSAISIYTWIRRSRTTGVRISQAA